MITFSGYIDFNGILTTKRIHKKQEAHGEKTICDQLITLLKYYRKDKKIPTTIELYPEYTDGNGKWENMKYKNMRKTIIDDIEILVQYADEEYIGKKDEIGPDIIWYNTKVPLRHLVFLYHQTFIDNTRQYNDKNTWQGKQKQVLIDTLEQHKQYKENSYINHNIHTALIGPNGIFVVDIGS